MGWTTVGTSVCGARHRRVGVGNQDAWEHRTVAPGVVLAAVADGHGGPAHPCSRQGAWLAVRTFLDLADTMPGGDAPFTVWEDWARQKVPAALIDHWRCKVANHGRGRTPVARATTPYLAYGTTLLGVLVSPTAWCCWQVGDGEILAVATDGRVSAPVPPDARLLGDVTTSLGAPTAMADFRIQVQPVTVDLPRLLLLCTDGYANAFATASGLHQAAGDFRQMLESDGPAAVIARLPDWLLETTDQGSGDDVTVLLLFRDTE